MYMPRDAKRNRTFINLEHPVTTAKIEMKRSRTRQIISTNDDLSAWLGKSLAERREAISDRAKYLDKDCPLM